MSLNKINGIHRDVTDDDDYEAFDQLHGIESLQIKYDDPSERFESLDGWQKLDCEGGEEAEMVEEHGMIEKKKKKKK